MKTRWVLTWKDAPEEAEGKTKRAKARLVVVGFTDPDLLDVPRDSPTLATRTRFMMFVITAAQCWSLYKGDVKTAFLQGDTNELARNVFGEAPPELL